MTTTSAPDTTPTPADYARALAAHLGPALASTGAQWAATLAALREALQQQAGPIGGEGGTTT